MQIKNVPIGQLLLEEHLITEQQLQKALEVQKGTQGKLLGDIIMELGYVNENQFARTLAKRLKIPYMDLGTASVSLEAVKRIPETLAKKHNVIAISISNGAQRLTVATNDPVNFYIFEDLKVVAGMDIYPVLSAKTAIRNAIEKYYSLQNMDAAMEDINKEYMVDADFSYADGDLSGERVESAPVVKLANTVIENAFHAGASDIHIEPFKEKTRIRIRIDGDLVEQMTISNMVHSSLVTRLKILSGMNIAEKRIPQDGRFSYEIDQNVLDVRVSNLPTVNGEKVVIRLLSTGEKTIRRITELGMTEYNYTMFRQMLLVPHGIILVTGPTGSGKTTTLYSALRQLAQPNVNIITVEDPVEKNLDGINQVQVNTKAGLTFAAGLRSILRQDPDIIMIGEIRDAETAEVAIRAAITGHLVLSTLHTNDAASTIVRLLDMGIAPYLVASSLTGVVAQRLVKLLCPQCKEPYAADESELRLLNQLLPQTLYRPCGCAACNGTGYRQRTSIHEIIRMTGPLKELVSTGATAQQIAAKAKESGTKLLRDNVADMVLEGKTSIGELIRVTYSL